MEASLIRNVLEACLLVAGKPMSISQLDALFDDDIDRPDKKEIRTVLVDLAEQYNDRGIELVEVAGGWRLQTRSSMEHWVGRLFAERPPRYSRALLETLVLIAYRQPITRGEIEEVRGVAVSSSIVRTLQEREWVREVGHKDVPGKPALLGTTNEFLDYFNLKRLDDLPALGELKDIDGIDAVLAAELGIVDETGEDAANDGESVEGQSGEGESSDGDMAASGDPSAALVIAMSDSGEATDSEAAVVSSEVTGGEVEVDVSAATYSEAAVVDGEAREGEASAAGADKSPQASDTGRSATGDMLALTDEIPEAMDAVDTSVALAVDNVVPIVTGLRRGEEEKRTAVNVEKAADMQEVRDVPHEIVDDAVATRAESLSLESVAERFDERAGASGLEDVELESVELESVELESVELESVELESVELESVELESVELESAIQAVRVQPNDQTGSNTPDDAQGRLLREVKNFADEHRREMEARDAFERQVFNRPVADKPTDDDPPEGPSEEPIEPDEGIP